MGSVGFPEVVVILFVALIVLGPDKLPGAARQVGKALAEFRRITSGFQDEVRTVFDISSPQADADGGTRTSTAHAEHSGDDVPPPRD